ncbi:hypothetical protein PRIPAC_79147 [Pristionchus pacificus]|uniref:Uncharacterized protein n=1 Tax=Pristionchus pacificus TaxID=54126 RepID=A0A454Y501_PRIPA|nr:hypothetical protein PRIPAC_79147 [Pristionchus pacificus]|eukprot:PDM79528.1 hypothetical protein PRIPAC_32107 [Pristionchus pacificus]
MRSTRSLLVLLHVATTLNAQGVVPVNADAMIAAMAGSPATAAADIVAILTAAQPFNCEVTQYNNAVGAAIALVNYASALPSATAAQGIINTLGGEAGSVFNWPACWGAEAQRVIEAALTILQSSAAAIQGK